MSSAPVHRIIVFFVSLSSIVRADAEPGRIPKVYNALITSNQNLAPSKAFPVYQPYVHQYGYPYFTPTYYGNDFDFSAAQLPPPYPSGPGFPPFVLKPTPPQENNNNPKKVGTENSDRPPTNDQPLNNNEGQSGPQTPPSTESPIPLNEFGLPPQVFPLNKLSPPPPRYPSPYDTFPLNPYQFDYNPYYFGIDPSAFGGQRPVFKYPGQEVEVPKQGGEQDAGRRVDKSVDLNNEKAKNELKNNEDSNVKNDQNSTPPPAPLDLDLNNFNKKNPEIPDVPPPPLPEGGLKQ